LFFHFFFFFFLFSNLYIIFFIYVLKVLSFTLFMQRWSKAKISIWNDFFLYLWIYFELGKINKKDISFILYWYFLFLFFVILFFLFPFLSLFFVLIYKLFFIFCKFYIEFRKMIVRERDSYRCFGKMYDDFLIYIVVHWLVLFFSFIFLFFLCIIHIVYVLNWWTALAFKVSLEQEKIYIKYSSFILY
jgi:hypothetical protein